MNVDAFLLLFFVDIYVRLLVVDLDVCVRMCVAQIHHGFPVFLPFLLWSLSLEQGSERVYGKSLVCRRKHVFYRRVL